jgi:phosphonopyruvate decarboxylase
MLDPQQFVDCLRDNGIDFFTGVPDSLLKDLCAYITHTSPADRHIIAANEGGCIGLALGYHLATRRIPLVYMQNSGLGNIVNPLLSLADQEVYAIPMLLVIGWRGEPGIHDEPQHKKQGRVMLAMLEAMEIPYSILGSERGEAEETIKQAVAGASTAGRPFALVVKKGTFKPFAAPRSEAPTFSLSREEAIQQVLGTLDPDDLVVCTTGMPSREVYEFRTQRASGHHRDFLTVGGMGHASQIALGIALRKQARTVYCLDGDGAVLMHMGALAINGTVKAPNFKHVVLNNGAHDSVGGQPTVGLKIDLLTLAKAVGYETALRAQTKQEVEAAIQVLKSSRGPSLLEIRIRCGARADLGRPLTTPVENKLAFMQFMDRQA